MCQATGCFWLHTRISRADDPGVFVWVPSVVREKRCPRISKETCRMLQFQFVCIGLGKMAPYHISGNGKKDNFTLHNIYRMTYSSIIYVTCSIVVQVQKYLHKQPPLLWSHLWNYLLWRFDWTGFAWWPCCHDVHDCQGVRRHSLILKKNNASACAGGWWSILFWNRDNCGVEWCIVFCGFSPIQWVKWFSKIFLWLFNDVK